MKRKGIAKRKKPVTSLVKCDKCGEIFWPGSLEELTNEKTCAICRRVVVTDSTAGENSILSTH